MAKKKNGSARPLTMAYAIRSFIGHLEGTGKSANTIGSYRSDLNSYQKFLEHESGPKPRELAGTSIEDLQRFHTYLKKEGFKTNTRRRKLLTVRRLYRYLNSRNRMESDIPTRYPAPVKVERVPETVPQAELIRAIRALPADDVVSARNRVLLWTLAETGCQVSELCRLRFECWSATSPAGEAAVEFEGKNARQVPVSPALAEAVADYERLASGVFAKGASKRGARSMFLGFNKFGPLSAAITPRGVELLVKLYSQRLEFSVELTPRLFRHSAVVGWFGEGVSREEIQRRLGLRTRYAFRVYEPLFKSMNPATSSL